MWCPVRPHCTRISVLFYALPCRFYRYHEAVWREDVGLKHPFSPSFTPSFPTSFPPTTFPPKAAWAISCPLGHKGQCHQAHRPRGVQPEESALRWPLGDGTGRSGRSGSSLRVQTMSWGVSSAGTLGGTWMLAGNRGCGKQAVLPSE